MNNEVKRNLVTDALKSDPTRSNRDIAHQEQVSEAFVRKVRKQLRLPKCRDKGGRRLRRQSEPPQSDTWKQTVQEALDWKTKNAAKLARPPLELPLEVPFPMFGGKAIAAKQVWQRFGNPAFYYEPFAGGLGVLLARPSPGKYEFINDADGLITNFWRAVKNAPDEVAGWADDPPNSLDLSARAKWVKQHQAALLPNLRTNPDFFDAKLAAWWVWCRCCTFNLNNKIALRLGPGNGIHRERQKDNLYGYLWSLAERLGKVSVYHGDWTGLAGFALRNAGVHTKSAIFLDPPYTRRTKRRANLYNHSSFEVGYYVQRWAVASASKHLKVALCGHKGEYEMPSTWQEVEWKSMTGDGRERIWFSS